MLLHYFKIAWRNLLKYKIQNVISVFSLAVGVVCFAITLYIMKSVVIDIYLSEIDTKQVHINAYKMTEEQYRNREILDKNFADIQGRSSERLDYDFVKRMHECEIPSMREHLYISIFMGKDTEYETRDGGRKILMTTFGSCSPRYFHYNFYNSAVTGKRIPELREGDVVITSDISEKVYGKGVDPRGLAIFDTFNGETVTICDVINTADHLDDNHSGIFIVSSLPFAHYYANLSLAIELAPGASAAKLQKELSSAIPEYYFTYTMNHFDWGSEGVIFVVFIFAVLLLGCSVLLIAVMGFLKMQLQLFTLRTRELALHRTMGARPWQLIMLFAIEIIIVFIFATVASILLTALLADYTLPIIRKIHGGLIFDLDAIYNLALWVILCAMLITLVIASIIVYRQLRQSVGMRVGRSGGPRTAGQGVMLSAQLAVSMILILAVLGLMYLINTTVREQSAVLPENPYYYRRALIMGGGMVKHDKECVYKIPDFKKRLMQSGTIEHISFAIIKPMLSLTLDKEMLMHYNERENENGVIEYEYHITVSDEGIFDNLGINVTSESPKGDTRHITAVYVRTEEVERLRKKWQLKPLSDAQTIQPFGNNSYTHIGYAKALQHYHYSALKDYTPAFWIVEEDEKIDVDNGFMLFDYIIFPKKGQYSECEYAIENFYRELHPNSVNDVPVNCLYDSWFPTMKVMELFGSLALLLVAVSIFCIVASLYSNISLESRGRQKEIALRKIHGAKSRDIMRLLGAYYIRLLIVAAAFVTALQLLFLVILHNFAQALEITEWFEFAVYLLVAIFIVAFVTLVTIAHRIYKVSKINPSEIIKKD